MLFGFISSDNGNEKLRDLIKTKIPIEKGYTQAIHIVIGLL
jgi:hypothetical protein